MTTKGKSQYHCRRRPCEWTSMMMMTMTNMILECKWMMMMRTVILAICKPYNGSYEPVKFFKRFWTCTISFRSGIAINCVPRNQRHWN